MHHPRVAVDVNLQILSHSLVKVYLLLYAEPSRRKKTANRKEKSVYKLLAKPFVPAADQPCSVSDPGTLMCNDLARVPGEGCCRGDAEFVAEGCY